MSNNNNKKHPLILVPVDFSKHSRTALLWACDLAHRLDAGVLVLHVVHDPAESPGYYKQSKGDLLRPMEEVAAKLMRRFVRGARKKMGDRKLPMKRMNTQLVVGLPVQRVLDVAKKEGAEQIVMGSQGRTGLKRLMLGSKAEHVVRLSPIPVTIVPATAK